MSLVHEIDYGTPVSPSAETVKLIIDGNEVLVPAGTSIMRAAMDAGIQVPKLCATDSVDAFGSCRPCLGVCVRCVPPLPGRDRGPPRDARLVHDAGCRRHGRVDPDRAAEADPQ